MRLRDPSQKPNDAQHTCAPAGEGPDIPDVGNELLPVAIVLDLLNPAVAPEASSIKAATSDQ
jgi:hypothetical protein